MTSAPVVEARGVVKHVRIGSQTRSAVAGVDLRALPGQLFLLLGRSGSGKTTLLSILGGLLEPDAGEVSVLGRELRALRPAERRELVRREIGWVFQTAGLMPGLTAAENVAFALYMLGMAGPEVDRRVAQSLEWVGVSARAAHRTDELSGGEQQRVALARALVKQPQLLLADEPTSQLDAETAQAVLQLLREVALSGTAVVLATHDEAARRVADSVAALGDGRIVDAVNP